MNNESENKNIEYGYSFRIAYVYYGNSNIKNRELQSVVGQEYNALSFCDGTQETKIEWFCHAEFQVCNIMAKLEKYAYTDPVFKDFYMKKIDDKSIEDDIEPYGGNENEIH